MQTEDVSKLLHEIEVAANRKPRALPLFDPQLVKPALVDAFKKLAPLVQMRNPVMFVVYCGSILTTALYIQALLGHGEAPAGFILAVTVWLWFTVLFANFAEALAEGRSKAQAASLRGARRDIMAKKLDKPSTAQAYTQGHGFHTCARATRCWSKRATSSRPTARLSRASASVDESAITGESAPVIRESGGDFSSVTGGTRVLSDWLVVRVTVNPGEAFWTA